MQPYIKVTISNNFVEVIQQTNPPLSRPTSKGGRNKAYYQTNEQYQANLKVSINRARKQIRRLLECNFTNQYAFVTLTFAPSEEIDVTDLKSCNKRFADFKKRLAYYLKTNNLSEFKYLGVTEFQDKIRQGAIHYHLVCNLTEVSLAALQDLWSYGWVNKSLVTSDATKNEKIAYYLKKGITDPRLNGHKRYFHSQGLKQPVILEGENAAQFYDWLEQCQATLKHGDTFHSPFTGETKYEQYYLQNAKELMEHVQDL